MTVPPPADKAIDVHTTPCAVAESSLAASAVAALAVSGVENAGSVGYRGTSGVRPGEMVGIPEGGPGTGNQETRTSAESAQDGAEENKEEGGLDLVQGQPADAEPG